MSKIFKVLINNVRTDKGWVHIKPPGWESKDIDVIADEFDGDRAAVLAREIPYSFRIVVVSDEYSGAFSQLPGTEEIDEVTALEFGESWRPADRIITDQKSILDIIDKLDKNDLTQKEKNALDPNSQEAGILLGEGFSDKLTWAKNKRQ